MDPLSVPLAAAAFCAFLFTNTTFSERQYYIHLFEPIHNISLDVFKIWNACAVGRFDNESLSKDSLFQNGQKTIFISVRRNVNFVFNSFPVSVKYEAIVYKPSVVLPEISWWILGVLFKENSHLFESGMSLTIQTLTCYHQFLGVLTDWCCRHFDTAPVTGVLCFHSGHKAFKHAVSQNYVPKWLEKELEISNHLTKTFRAEPMRASSVYQTSAQQSGIRWIMFGRISEVLVY